MICLKCPFCFFDESKVVDSRSTDDNTTIRRRRECTSCGRRYTTYEKIEDIPILVVKRDLTRENFNREKIVNGLIIACQKRHIVPPSLHQENILLKLFRGFYRVHQTLYSGSCSATDKISSIILFMSV